MYFFTFRLDSTTMGDFCPYILLGRLIARLFSGSPPNQCLPGIELCLSMSQSIFNNSIMTPCDSHTSRKLVDLLPITPFLWFSRGRGVYLKFMQKWQRFLYCLLFRSVEPDFLFLWGTITLGRIPYIATSKLSPSPFNFFQYSVDFSRVKLVSQQQGGTGLDCKLVWYPKLYNHALSYIYQLKTRNKV